MLALMPWASATQATEAPSTWVWAVTWILSSGLYRHLLGVGAIASLAIVCMIFIVHTMHDCRCYLKMASPDAYSQKKGYQFELGKRELLPSISIDWVRWISLVSNSKSDDPSGSGIDWNLSSLRG